MMLEHYEHYYGGVPWANEIAKRGYGVLVPDAFPFASRRVRMADVADSIRKGLTDDDPEDPEDIADLLNEFLEDVPARSRLAKNAHRRVHEEFLIFTQVRRWLEVLEEQAGR